MMNIIANIFSSLANLMLNVISILVNAVETVGVAINLTPHEARMCFVIAVGVSLGIQSARSLERMRSREKDIETAIREADIDGVFNRITNPLQINKAAKKAADVN